VLVLIQRGHAARRCRGAEPLTMEVSEEQGSSESRSRAGKPWRVSNPRRVGLGQGGTPLVVGAGARKPHRSAEAQPLPHNIPKECIYAHFPSVVTLVSWHGR